MFKVRNLLWVFFTLVIVVPSYLYRDKVTNKNTVKLGFEARLNQTMVANSASIYESLAIYQYVDESGNLVVSNKKRSGARKMELQPLAVYANPMSANDLFAENYTKMLGKDLRLNGKYGNIPNVDNRARTGVLQEELVHERVALNEARKLLNNALVGKMIGEDEANYRDRMQLLTDNITEHQKNIELLTKIVN